MRGGHCLKVRTKKQQVVSLSTAESERYAAVNTAPEGLRYAAVNPDASAAPEKGWRFSKSKRFVTKNVGTKLNAADLMTKPLPGPQILQLLQMMGCEFVEQHLEREGLTLHKTGELAATCRMKFDRGVLAVGYGAARRSFDI